MHDITSNFSRSRTCCTQKFHPSGILAAQLLLFLLTFLGSPLVSMADSVLMRDRSRIEDVRVSAMEAQTLRLADGREMALSDIHSVSIDRFRVPEKPSGIMLQNGTSLNGVILAREPAKIRFRSASLGIMEIPVDAIAAVYYQPRADLPVSLPRENLPIVMDRQNQQHQGRLLWFDGGSVGLRGEAGLARFPSEELRMVIIRAVRNQPIPRMILRNGDVISGPFSGKGATIEVQIIGNQYSVSLAAVAELVLANQQ